MSDLPTHRAAPRADAAVRLLSSSGRVVGGGVLLGPDLVGSCAHVVAEILGVDAYADTDEGDEAPAREDVPSGELVVDFPLRASARANARVWRWEPIRPDGSGDVALLRLSEPPPAGVRMPPLRRVEQTWGRAFSVLGFPPGAVDGVWSTGTFRAGQGTGWTQLQSAVGDQRIEEGFSGAPVWDQDHGAVVGIAVATDRDPGTTTAYLLPIDRVLGLDPSALPNPYPGLAHFDEEHASFFFGREDLVAELGRRIDTAITDGDGLVAVIGPSGAGKSSVVAAGLVPLLRSADREVLRHHAGRLRPSVPHTPDLVVVLDQFEESVGADPRGAASMLADLLASGPACVVLTLRPESLADLTSPQLAARLGRGAVLVPPMGRTQLRAAVVGPAERAPGLAFEDGLVDRILDDAGEEPGRLPLLALLLARLWERHEGGRLTHAGYEGSGGVAGSVARQAESLVDDLSDDKVADLRILLSALTRSEREGRFVRRPVRAGDLALGPAGLVPLLIAQRLAVLDGPVIELAHQALIDHWPRLRNWLREDQEFLAWRAEVDDAATRWRTSGEDHGTLLRGAGLYTARQWIDRRSADVAPATADYVARSSARRRREARRWRTVSAVLLVLVLMAGASTVLAVQRGNRVDRQLQVANAEILGRAATAKARVDVTTAAQLALAAHRADPSNPVARTALSEVYANTRSVTSILPEAAPGPITAFSASRDGDVAIAGGADFVVALRGMLGGRPETWSLPGFDTRRYTWVSSPDHRWVVAADTDGTLLSWDVATKRGPTMLLRGSGRGSPTTSGQQAALSFSPDASRFAYLPTGAAGLPRRLLTWAAGDWTQLPAGFDLGGELDPFGFALIDDPTLVAIRLLGATQIREIGSGLVRRTTAERSRVVGGREVTCNLENGDWTLVVRDAATGRELGRKVLDASCGSAGGRPDTTLDGRHVVLTGVKSRPTSLVALDGPEALSGYLPPETRPLGTSLGDDVSVVVGPGGERSLLSAHGRSLIRVAAVPTRAVDATGDVMPAAGGRLLIVRAPDAYRSVDAATGAVLGVLPMTPATRSLDLFPSGEGLRPGGIDDVEESHDGPRVLTRYRFPDLAPVLRIPLPGPATRSDDDGSDVTTTDDGRIVALVGGVLSTWDGSSGAPLTDPTPLGTSAPEVDRYRRTLVLAPRPDHPDEVALVSPDLSVEVWSLDEPRPLTRIPTAGIRRGFAFDPSGRRLVTATPTELRVSDVDTAAPARPPIAARAENLLGVTADGYVLIAPPYSATDEGVELWDLDRGERSGALVAPIDVSARIAEPPDTRHDGRTLGLPTSGQPLTLLTTGQGWAGHLCTLANRPFTSEELRLLPPGAATSRPCEDVP